MDVVLGRNVTLRTLLDRPIFSFIVWTYNDGSEQTHVATLSSNQDLNVNAPYQGRASIDGATGALRLAAAQGGDSGDFGISVISQDGSTRTGEIRLRVLGECPRAPPGPPPHDSLWCHHFAVSSLFRASAGSWGHVTIPLIPL